MLSLKTDGTREEQVINMLKTAIEKLRSLEIIVNNVGIITSNPSIEMGLGE